MRDGRLNGGLRGNKGVREWRSELSKEDRQLLTKHTSG